MGGGEGKHLKTKEGKENAGRKRKRESWWLEEKR